MERTQEIALELLAEYKEAYEMGDDLTDLVKSDGHTYGNNQLYLGNIGRYEVWESRSGFGVWLGDICQCIAFETLRQAVEYARELNAKAMAEEARYLAVRRFPRRSSVTPEATTGGRAPTAPPVEGTSKAGLSGVVKSQTREGTSIAPKRTRKQAAKKPKPMTGILDGIELQHSEGWDTTPDVEPI